MLEILEENYFDCKVTHDIIHNIYETKHLKSNQKIVTTNLRDSYFVAKLLDLYSTLDDWLYKKENK